ncbi:hypothetical protein EBU58_14260, partial [bacterium]|nr:hypothetical protein [bacterium]
WSREPAKWLGPDISRPQGPYRLPENVALRKKNAEEMFAKYGEAAKRGLASGPAYESADVADHEYVDGYNTLLAIKTMKQMASAGKPFFLAMGFHLPHLNWCAPKRYWDLYEPSEIPLIDAGQPPASGAAMGLHASFELRTRSNIPKHGPLDEALARRLKHAYLASTSYVDAQVGLLLAALDEAGLRDNTIVVVWGDHGWHLGDMGVWGKATNYEIATRVPLMISVPGMAARGQSSDALVELVDLFPTLCELADVSRPEHLEGHSFVPLLSEPGQAWKKAAFSQYPNPALREWAANPLSEEMRETWFGPLIEEVEQRIIDQQGDPAVDEINSHIKNIRFSSSAGPHKLAVTFVQRSLAEFEGTLHAMTPVSGENVISLNSIELLGPYNPAGLSETPAREKIFTCYPQASDQERACAGQII